MVRAPCCEKMGLKKGPWTAEEDEILVSYINRNGHGNWRALPKQAGLLRCGKSCRLRWTNYLRPDIKRGNFTLQEEETIIKLHEELGNRWSAIAARLPGRTDNEIKNVWHTYLKKRMVNTSDPNPNSSQQTKRTRRSTTNTTKRANPVVTHRFANAEPESSPESCISTDQTSPYVYQINYEVDEFIGDIPEIDESFWSEPLSVEEESQETNGNSRAGHVVDDEGDDMGFWLRVLMEAGSSSTQLPSF